MNLDSIEFPNAAIETSGSLVSLTGVAARFSHEILLSFPSSLVFRSPANCRLTIGAWFFAIPEREKTSLWPPLTGTMSTGYGWPGSLGWNFSSKAVLCTSLLALSRRWLFVSIVNSKNGTLRLWICYRIVMESVGSSKRATRWIWRTRTSRLRDGTGAVSNFVVRCGRLWLIDWLIDVLLLISDRSHVRLIDWLICKFSFLFRIILSVFFVPFFRKSAGIQCGPTGGISRTTDLRVAVHHGEKRGHIRISSERRGLGGPDGNAILHSPRRRGRRSPAGYSFLFS